MGKIGKIKRDGQQVFPKTVVKAIKDTDSGKMLGERLADIEQAVVDADERAQKKEVELEGTISQEVQERKDVEKRLGDKMKLEVDRLDEKINNERSRAILSESGKTIEEVGVIRTESTLVVRVAQKDGGNATTNIPPATPSSAGVMTSADKAAIKDLEQRLPRVEGIKIVELSPVVGRELRKWQLRDADDMPMGPEIVTYKDQFIKSIEFEKMEDAQVLKITYIDSEGLEKVARTDISELVIQAEFKKGFEVNAKGEVSVKLSSDRESKNYLYFAPDGSLTLRGIEAFMKDEEDKRQELYEKVEGKDTEHPSINPQTGSRWARFNYLKEQMEGDHQKGEAQLAQQDEAFERKEAERNQAVAVATALTPRVVELEGNRTLNVDLASMNVGDELPKFSSECKFSFGGYPSHTYPAKYNGTVYEIACAYHNEVGKGNWYYVFNARTLDFIYDNRDVPQWIKDALPEYLTDKVEKLETIIIETEYAADNKTVKVKSFSKPLPTSQEEISKLNAKIRIVGISGTSYTGTLSLAYTGSVSAMGFATGAYNDDKIYKVSIQNLSVGAVVNVENVSGKVDELAQKTNRNTDVLGPYADRAPIVLTLEENNKAINRAGVKVTKNGWAICSFIGQKGDVYSFDPGTMDSDVCIFSEEIVKKEYRPIEYKYTYDTEGLPTKATATYNGAVHSYTFTYEKDAEGHVTNETITDDQTKEVLNALPYQYQSMIGTYHPLTILNASAELPLDHHCRLVSHFQGEGTIRVTVSFNVASANMNLLVFRDGLIANLATQLGTIFQMISETNKALALAENTIETLSATVQNIVTMPVDDSALPLLCGQPPILFGAGIPQEAIVPMNWKQFDMETGEGYNWNGEPSAIGQQYINTSVTTGGRYNAVPSADGGLTWKNF